MKLISTST